MKNLQKNPYVMYRTKKHGHNHVKLMILVCSFLHPHTSDGVNVNWNLVILYSHNVVIHATNRD